MKYSLLIIAIILGACAQTQQAKNLDAKAFKELIAQTPNAIIVDVRTDGEVAQGVIENAILIDFNGQNFELNLDQLDKNKPTFLYCASGGRSGSASKIMVEKGFKQVYNLNGGINAWRAEGYPTTNLKP